MSVKESLKSLHLRHSCQLFCFLFDPLSSCTLYCRGSKLKSFKQKQNVVVVFIILLGYTQQAYGLLAGFPRGNCEQLARKAGKVRWDRMIAGDGFFLARLHTHSGKMEALAHATTSIIPHSGIEASASRQASVCKNNRFVNRKKGKPATGLRIAINRTS